MLTKAISVDQKEDDLRGCFMLLQISSWLIDTQWIHKLEKEKKLVKLGSGGESCEDPSTWLMTSWRLD
jgi:hypothetical protein